jgi:xanthine dehydrogenase accessory factor
MQDAAYFLPPHRSKPILVLGTDDVASAVGWTLANAGIRTVLVRDPKVPVLRRTMSYDAALDTGSATLEGITAAQTGHPWLGGLLAVSSQDPDMLMDPLLVEGVIDARMRRRAEKSDLRGSLGFAIGLGPGFTVGVNVDVAIETAPEATGAIVRRGSTIPAHGKSAIIGGVGRQRFGRIETSGLWWSSCAIGDAVDADMIIGHCAGVPVRAPVDGCLRGLVRTGMFVQARTRVLEVDPRGSQGQYSGIPPRARKIAAATLTALREVSDMSCRVQTEEAATWLH